MLGARLIVYIGRYCCVPRAVASFLFLRWCSSRQAAARAAPSSYYHPNTIIPYVNYNQHYKLERCIILPINDLFRGIVEADNGFIQPSISLEFIWDWSRELRRRMSELCHFFKIYDGNYIYDINNTRFLIECIFSLFILNFSTMKYNLLVCLEVRVNNSIWNRTE